MTKVRISRDSNFSPLKEPSILKVIFNKRKSIKGEWSKQVKIETFFPQIRFYFFEKLWGESWYHLFCVRKELKLSRIYFNFTNNHFFHRQILPTEWLFGYRQYLRALNHVSSFWLKSFKINITKYFWNCHSIFFIIFRSLPYKNPPKSSLLEGEKDWFRYENSTAKKLHNSTIRSIFIFQWIYYSGHFRRWYRKTAYMLTKLNDSSTVGRLGILINTHLLLPAFNP